MTVDPQKTESTDKKIQVRLPKATLEYLDLLVAQGEYLDRNEAIRAILWNHIKADMQKD